MSIHLKFAALCAAVVTIFASSAGAATYDINRQSISSFYNAPNPVWVALDHDDWSSTRYAGVGGYALTATDTNNPSTVYTFTAWCIDLLTDISGDLNSTYVNTVTAQKTRPTGLWQTNTTRVGLVERLFEAVYTPALALDRIQAAGFQLAIWELLYEGSGSYDLGSGEFGMTPWVQADLAEQDLAMTAANNFLLQLNNGPATDYDFNFLVDVNGVWGPNSSQLLIVPVHTPTPVPLPAPALLLIGGLGAMAAMRRRKSQA